MKSSKRGKKPTKGAPVLQDRAANRQRMSDDSEDSLAQRGSLRIKANQKLERSRLITNEDESDDDGEDLSSDD